MRRTPFFLLVLFVIGGCSSSTSTTTADFQILPLSVGNRWIEQISTIDTSGKVRAVRLDTIAVVSSTVVNGETWYRLNHLFAVMNVTTTSALVNRKDGLYVCDSDHFQNASRLLKFPAVSGDTVISIWQKEPPGSSDYGVWYILTDTIEPVTVPAGNLTAFSYSVGSILRNSDYIESVFAPQWYFAPGVGPIQTGFYDSDGKTPNRYSNPQEVWQLVRAEVH